MSDENNLGDPVKRALEAEEAADVDFAELTPEQIKDLEAEPDPEPTAPILLDADDFAWDPDEDDLVEDDSDDEEVTEENYMNFLPEYTDDSPPGINLLALENAGELLTAQGLLMSSAQEAYDEPPPDPQEAYDPEGEEV